MAHAGSIDGVANIPLTWLAGTDVPNGDYKLIIQSRTPVQTSAAITNDITIRVTEGPLGAGSIAGHVLYAGSRPGTIRVLAFDSTGFSGAPVGQSLVDADGNYHILGLRKGTYTVMAVVDTNGDGRLSANEPWGIVKAGLTVRPLRPTALPIWPRRLPFPTVARFWGRMSLSMTPARALHADTDGDGLTDAQEVDVLERIRSLGHRLRQFVRWRGNRGGNGSAQSGQRWRRHAGRMEIENGFDPLDRVMQLWMPITMA